MGKYAFQTFIAFVMLFAYCDAAYAKNSPHSKTTNKIHRAKVKTIAKKTSAKSARRVSSLGSAMSEPRGPQQPLQVKGQARQLSMMLVLKNEKDSINFVRLRTDYQTEIVNTEF